MAEYRHRRVFKSNAKTLLFPQIPSGTKAVRASIHSPWQNGVAERWVGSIRREMLDHVIPLDERHLIRLSLAYVCYYHDDRTHVGLNKETPGARPTESRPDVVRAPRVSNCGHP